MAYPITRPGSVPVPYAYTLGRQETFRALSIAGTWNGGAAAGSFIPCVSVYSQDGQLLGRYKGDATVSAGDTSTEATFAPFLRQLESAVPAPQPNPLGTLFAWYDYSDATTVTLDGSGRITQIADKTGNGHDATQATASKRPTTATVNGLTAGLFNTANQTILQTGFFSTALVSPITIASVFTNDSAAGASFFPGVYGSNVVTNNVLLFYGANLNVMAAQFHAGGSITVPIATPFTQQQATVTYKAVGADFRFNAVSHTGGMTPNSVTSFMMGSTADPNQPGEEDHWGGKICEILIYEGALTSSTILAVESYLKTKWATP